MPAQRSRPPASTPHVPEVPAEIVVSPLALAATGDQRIVNVPSASSPRRLYPQHQGLPPARRPQVWLCPASAAVQSLAAPTWVGVGRDVAIVPAPTRPSPLKPQHQRVPSVPTPQV